jgi:hypothetical protein
MGANSQEARMHKYLVITWRQPGGPTYFFRGDNRREIFLPYISADFVGKGWVEDHRYARLFDTFPIFSRQSFAKSFDMERMRVFTYDTEVLPTHLLRSVRRPPW